MQYMHCINLCSRLIGTIALVVTISLLSTINKSCCYIFAILKLCEACL